MSMRAIALVLTLAPLPAVAQDPLQTLVPLLEVFGAGSSYDAAYDVAGIRCAGLYYAQETWRQQHGGGGPTLAQLQAGAVSLQRSVQQRISDGMDIVAADQSVEADLLRIHALYLERFTGNAAGGHPWRNDRDLQGDMGYCEVAAG